MFEHLESPPPLHHSPATSDQSRVSSRDSTRSPSTPVLELRKDAAQAQRQALPWFIKKPTDVGKPTTSLSVDNALLEPDFEDSSFPLFGETSSAAGRMAGAASPIDIAPRQISTSPRGPQPSNLTSALRKSPDGPSIPPHTAALDAVSNGNHRDSNNRTPARLDNGAVPIFPGDKPRRESIARSMGTGMSWGGISVSSWIRDDIMMSGTSPMPFHQSSSYHSSSYVPKFEADFMRDFSCCGMTLPSLHDLLQHYEEAHAPKTEDGGQAVGPQQPQMPDSRAAIATNAAAAIQHQAQQQNQQHVIPPVGMHLQQPVPQHVQQRQGPFSSTLQTIPDMDTVDDMEMDDVTGEDETTPPSNLYTQTQSPRSPAGQFAQPQVPQLNTSMMQGHQNFRNSTPSTPVAASRPGGAFQNTSNVNTPTLMANPMQQQFQDLSNQYRSTPDSSAPGTPGELDESLIGGMDDMAVTNNNMNMGNFNFNGMGGLPGYGMSSDMLDLCIDEPAKRLFSPTGGFGNQLNQQYTHYRLGSGQYGANSDIAKRIREQQMLAGLPDTTTNIPPHEEPKPFRCPVIGCEKAYKNQNGLKYHKSHGHNNQRLHDNADGTYSIVNPETSAPYPGTMGMEKEKPYKCEVCQKRYKNLNGLKYHKTHSPPCNPDLQLNDGNGVKPPSSGLGTLLPSNMGNLGPGGSGNLSMA